MDAKELHELYAPLWALVPATKPTHYDNGEPWFLEMFDHADNFSEGGLVWWNYDTREGQRPYPEEVIDAPSAAALCRVAVEDWLRNQYPEYGVYLGPTHTTLPGQEEMVAWDTHWDCDSRRGPTIHHALVAAAIAVAGAAP